MLMNQSTDQAHMGIGDLRYIGICKSMSQIQNSLIQLSSQVVSTCICSALCPSRNPPHKHLRAASTDRNNFPHANGN
jgi:hypothetical protein